MPNGLDNDNNAPAPSQGNGNWPGGAVGGGANPAGFGLPDHVRQSMEGQFGADFSDVRVVNNSCVPGAIGAQALTHGNDIHFSPGQYNPSTPAGRQLLSHELIHLTQQRQGRVRPAQPDAQPAAPAPAPVNPPDNPGAGHQFNPGANRYFYAQNPYDVQAYGGYPYAE